MNILIDMSMITIRVSTISEMNIGKVAKLTKHYKNY